MIEGYELIESEKTRVSSANINKKPTRVHEVSETTSLFSHVAQIYNMMMVFITPPKVPVAEPVNVITDATEVTFCLLWR